MKEYFKNKYECLNWGSKRWETLNARMQFRGVWNPHSLHEVRVFEIASQSIKIDMLITLFIEQLSASKEIVHHTIEPIFGVHTTPSGYIPDWSEITWIINEFETVSALLGRRILKASYHTVC